ncbi:amino acid transporter AVT6A isoform X5 [Ziziphus jujuba]|uniref:Amino acid transporter AVT6A isoform X5 n=1 Tax=Ziziphus jujuba TaxID=326968 RepID=A0A6P3ZXV8_ZIZJJ|nr:amino acid transporter AVT6A isoform X5 [Ziziphus jujuba]
MTSEFEYITERKHSVGVRTPLLPIEEDDEVAAEIIKTRGASFHGSVFNLSCTVIGSGIMSLPATLKVLGLVPGVALIVIAAFLTDTSIEMLLRFSKPGLAFSYSDLMDDAFGKIGKILLQICVIINNIGCLIVYMIIIEDVLSGSTSSGVHNSGVLEEWCGEHWWTGRAFVLLVLTIVIFIPLICFQRIVHPIENELEDSSDMRAIVLSSVALCATVYVMTGLFGFLLFGNSTLSDLLSNFDTDLGIPHSSLFNDIIRLSYAGHIMLVYPIVFFPLRLNLDGLLFPSAGPLTSDKMRFALISMGLIAISLVGAIFIPTIWIAFEFTGATVGVLIAYIFPASITLKDPHGIATKKDKIVSVFMIIGAVFSNVVAIYSDAYSLLE